MLVAANKYDLDPMSDAARAWFDRWDDHNLGTFNEVDCCRALLLPCLYFITSQPSQERLDFLLATVMHITKSKRVLEEHIHLPNIIIRMNNSPNFIGILSLNYATHPYS